MLLPILLAVSTCIAPPARALQKSGSKPPSERLAAVLEDWRTAEERLQDFHTVLRRTVDDRTWHTRETTLIEITGKKPDLMRIEIQTLDKKPVMLLVLGSDRTRLLDYSNRRNMTQERNRTRQTSWPDESDLFALLRRGGLPCFDSHKLLQDYEPSLDGEDAFYWYLSLRLSGAAKSRSSWFFSPPSHLQIALLKKDHLPRQVLVHEQSGTFTKLETLSLKTNLTPPIAAEAIEADLPVGRTKGK
jgi:hypothetical protein